MNLEDLVDKDFTAVSPDMEMGQLVHAISRSRTSYIPVLDDAGHLLGEIDITKIRHVIFRTELYHRFKVSQLMTPPAAILHETDNAEEVMRKFDETGAQMLPILDSNECLKGYITRTHMYGTYRQIVADLSEE